MRRTLILFMVLAGMARGQEDTGFQVVDPSKPRSALASGAADPFKPSVTPREAERLNGVVQVSNTNIAAAVRVLLSEPIQESSAAFDFVLGNFYFQLESYTHAETSYRNALVKLPNYRDALSNLGRIYLLKDQPAKTVETYLQLVKNGKADADVYLLLGQAQVMQAQYASAETAFRQALLLAPGHRDARTGLSKCLVEQERYQEAASMITELLNQDPRRRELWALKANIHLALDEEERAMVFIETARRLGQAQPDLLITLGNLYLNREQPAQAYRSFQQAFALRAPDFAQLLRAAEGFIMVESVDQAADLLTRADALRAAAPAALNPKDIRRHLRLRADLALLRDDLDGAERAYQEVLKQDPLDGYALLRLGDLYRGKDAMEDAVMSYERAARVKGFESRGLIRQAQAEVERERYRKAVTLLESAQSFSYQAHVAKYLDQLRRLISN